jgi:hypothetical protein
MRVLVWSVGKGALYFGINDELLNKMVGVGLEKRGPKKYFSTTWSENLLVSCNLTFLQLLFLCN